MLKCMKNNIGILIFLLANNLKWRLEVVAFGMRNKVDYLIYKTKGGIYSKKGIRELLEYLVRREVRVHFAKFLLDKERLWSYEVGKSTINTTEIHIHDLCLYFLKG